MRTQTNKRKTNMKKIYTLAALMMLTVPAYATDDNTLQDENIPSTETSVSSDQTGEDATATTETSTEPAKTGIFNQPEAKFPHGLQFGVGISATSGLNGFVGYANKNLDSFWLKRLGVRLDFAGTAPVKSLINSGIDSIMGDGIDFGDGMAITDAGIGAQHFAALIDIYPFGNTWFLGGLRISGGYYWGDLELSAHLSGEISDMPGEGFSFSLDGKDYRYTGNQIYASANMNWNTSGPYLGAGFDLGLFAGLKIYLDAGVVFTSRAAQLGLDIPLDNLQVYEGGNWKPVKNSPVSEDQLDQAQRTALAEAQNELDKLTFYPIIKLGFMYRF